MNFIKTFYALTFALLLFSCSTKRTGQISVKITGANEQTEKTLIIYDYQRIALDTINIVNNTTQYFSNTLKTPQILYLKDSESNQGEMFSFILEKNIDIKIDLSKNNDISKETINFSQQETKLVKEYIEYTDKYDAIKLEKSKAEKEWFIFREKYKDTIIPAEARKPFDENYDRTYKKEKGFTRSYIKNNNNLITQYLYATSLRFSYNAEKLKKIISTIPDEYKNTVYSRSLKEKLTLLERIKIGEIAPEIIRRDTLNNEISLSSLRGKYVLLDFWASWCVPCRKENSWVKKAYKKYHKEGFDIYAVSFDYPGMRSNWVQAIKDDELSGIHVSNLSGWQDPAAKTYNLSGIPSPFLIDPTGKIIKKNYQLREEKLLNVLDSIFKK